MFERIIKVNFIKYSANILKIITGQVPAVKYTVNEIFVGRIGAM